ncbi:hypothetical protein EHV15_34650 [Paenibacillus oralis]|uniref:Uncharacterized protein n=1 Tax=Paenibacillus oralis TaxID=2490856 RepID=A0A3P3TD13_9BACL|nr:hypothetical protein EHV15_34650 [Paenibacillus oralis]
MHPTQTSTRCLCVGVTLFKT